MTRTWRDLLAHLATIEPIAVPEGEPGVRLQGEPGDTGRYVPVLSVYLDWRPQATGARVVRTGAVVLAERLRAIARTFWPRGSAYDAFQADAARIERYLATQVSPEVQGVALFASDRHHLFETLETGVPFNTQVSARAVPNLFQLAWLLDDQETAVIALVQLNTARLFVTSRGLFHEVRGLHDDPKFYHKVRRTNGLNQTHYQRHADQRRVQFARETAVSIERLVEREQAVQVILAGEAVAVSLVRQILPPPITSLVQEQAVRLDIHEPPNAILEEVEPLLLEAEADQDRSVVERLVGEVQSDGLGVSGLELTRAALQQAQVDILVLAGDMPFPPETRSALIDSAVNTGASVEIVEGNANLNELGGVGALLRYRYADPAETGVYIPPAAGATNMQQQI